MARELIIYADESTKRGRYFANFYGGVLIWSHHMSEVGARLQRVKEKQNLHHEVKWQKVTGNYLHKYCVFVDEFFDLIEEGKAKVRIMFTQNYWVPIGLGPYQREHEYHILYYQFLKHAFGLEYANSGKDSLSLRIYFDKMPDTREKNARFKSFVRALENSPAFRRSRIRLPIEQMAEISSHDHVALQALDVVLGSIQFRLNEKHREKLPGSRCRGKKTVAKEGLYKHVNRRIRKLYPRFNVGVTTGQQGSPANRWHHPYRHWRFMPSRATPDPSKAKRR